VSPAAVSGDEQTAASPSAPATSRTIPHLALRYDFRAPDVGTSSAGQLGAAMEQVAFVERHGFERVQISEHHGSDDGYCPAPFVAAAAMAARTTTLRIRLSALVLTLYDPVRAAEDTAFLDVVSNGRSEFVVAPGYVEDEFRMLDRPFAGRGAVLEESIAVLRRAWSGERFEWRGRPVSVRPLPVQRPGPPILIGGGTARSIRRAAEIGDGFEPTDPSLVAVYREECARLGRPPGDARPKVGPFFLHVAEDPERARALIGPHVQHEMLAYSRWAATASPIGGTPDIPLDAVWGVGSHVVATPDECVDLVRGLDPTGTLILHPLAGGLDPALAEESLQLFASRVLPALTP
jgi:alkanesulfonate monooxygenase SsuD/methylene tetrahydromethanopterin reductase-like flavin-dependent oxidoreductase (luciferase family)